MCAPMFASHLLGAIGLCQWSQVVVRVHARAPTVRKFHLGRAMLAPTFTSFFQGARCARPCSRVMFRAHSACARGRKPFIRRSPVPVVGRAQSAPLYREEVGGCREGDAVGALGRARDRVVRGGGGDSWTADDFWRYCRPSLRLNSHQMEFESRPLPQKKVEITFEICSARRANSKIARKGSSKWARLIPKTSRKYPPGVMCSPGQIKKLQIFRQARNCRTLPWPYTSAIRRALNVGSSAGLGRKRAPCALDKTYCTYCTGARTSCAEVEVERALGALCVFNLCGRSSHLVRFLTDTTWCPPQHCTHQPPSQIGSRPPLS